jgi:hypothetical protein
MKAYMLIRTSSTNEHPPPIVTTYNRSTQAPPNLSPELNWFIGESSDKSICLYAGIPLNLDTSIQVLDCNLVDIYLLEKMKQDMSSEFMRIMNEGQQDASLHWIRNSGAPEDHFTLMTSSVSGVVQEYVWWTIRLVNVV